MNESEWTAVGIVVLVRLEVCGGMIMVHIGPCVVKKETFPKRLTERESA